MSRFSPACPHQALPGTCGAEARRPDSWPAAATLCDGLDEQLRAQVPWNDLT